MVNFRHEIKLLMSQADYNALQPLLHAMLPFDPNASESGEYFIRSLYFDDISKTAYSDKLAGVADRKKYRMRIYDLSDSVIKLECKEKRGDRIRKRSALISRECADLIVKGDFSMLADSDNPLCHEIYSLSRSKGLKPSVIVDYDREAYLHPVSDVRLTFDKALHAAVESPDIFCPDIMSIPVFPDGSMIFEIKYNEIIPVFIRNLVSTAHGSKLALSKFTLCRDVMMNFKPEY